MIRALKGVAIEVLGMKRVGFLWPGYGVAFIMTPRGDHRIFGRISPSVRPKLPPAQIMAGLGISPDGRSWRPQ